MKLFYCIIISCWLFAGMGIQGFSQDFHWGRQIGGSGWDEASDIKTDQHNNVYTVGLFRGTVDFDPGPAVFNLTAVGEKDVFICKLDSAGHFLWAKQYGDSASIDEKSSLAIDASGNLYITNSFLGSADFNPGPASFNLTSQGSDRDIFIQKLDADGNFIWAKQIGGPFVPLFPTPAHSNAIALDEGGIYLTGYFDGTIDFDPNPGATYNMTSQFGGTDIFVCKLDTGGNFIWAKQFTGTLARGGVGYGIATDGLGNVYTTGTIGGMVDFDPGPNTFYLNISDSIQTEMFLCKLNPAGEFAWAKAMGSGEGSAIALDPHHNVYSSGWFPLGTTPVINKLDSAGNLLWAKQLGGFNGQSIAIDNSGYVYTVGFCSGTNDFDPGPGVFNLTAGNSDAYISKLDSLGNFSWAGLIQGSGQVAINNITADKDDNIYTTGYFSETTDFDPSSAVHSFVSHTGSYDVFIQKMRMQKATGLLDVGLQSYVRVYPNPTTGHLFIESNRANEQLQLVLRNVAGQEIDRYWVADKQRIEFPATANGVYLLEISDRHNNKAVVKIIKH